MTKHQKTRLTYFIVQRVQLGNSHRFSNRRSAPSRTWTWSVLRQNNTNRPLQSSARRHQVSVYAHCNSNAGSNYKQQTMWMMVTQRTLHVDHTESALAHLLPELIIATSCRSAEWRWRLEAKVIWWTSSKLQQNNTSHLLHWV